MKILVTVEVWMHVNLNLYYSVKILGVCIDVFHLEIVKLSISLF